MGDAGCGDGGKRLAGRGFSSGALHRRQQRKEGDDDDIAVAVAVAVAVAAAAAAAETLRRARPTGLGAGQFANRMYSGLRPRLRSYTSCTRLDKCKTNRFLHNHIPLAGGGDK